MLKVALLQLMPGNTLKENLEAGLAACRKAREMGANIALFPEMWSDGYLIPEKDEERKALAISAEDAFVAAFGELAAELKDRKSVV